MDDNDDGESQKFLSNGIMKKKKYEEYHEEYVSNLFTVFKSLFIEQAAPPRDGAC